MYLKRQKHITEFVLEAQNRTGSENWVTFDLLRPTQSGKKWSFDWIMAMLAWSSYLLHWLQHWMPRAMTLSCSTFWRGRVCFHPFTSAHARRPFFTHQQRGKIFHNLFLSLTKNHSVLVSRTESRAVKSHLRAGTWTSSLATPPCARTACSA